jgi:hypothetical protein
MSDIFDLFNIQNKLFNEIGSYESSDFTIYLEKFITNELKEDLNLWKINKTLAYTMNSKTLCAIQRTPDNLEITLLINGEIKWRVSNYCL